jgi:hypothetical protein
MTLLGTNSRLEIAQDAGPQDWLITAQVRQMKWRRTKRLLDAVLVALYRALPPPGTPLMLVRLVEGYGIDKNWRSLDDISPHLTGADDDDVIFGHECFSEPGDGASLRSRDARLCGFPRSRPRRGFVRRYRGE